MINPDNFCRRPRVALLGNGAHFSCAVLRALIDIDLTPDLLVIPEYPPAYSTRSSERELFSSATQSEFLQLGGGIELIFAPKQQQTDCARRIKQHAIDFILVACWPYLIGKPLINSATRAALNLHPSLLPLYRGANPVRQQLDAGDRRFGVTLHLLGAEFDRGGIIARTELDDLDPNPVQGDIEQLCARCGATLFKQSLEEYQRGWKPVAQSAYLPET